MKRWLLIFAWIFFCHNCNRAVYWMDIQPKIGDVARATNFHTLNRNLYNDPIPNSECLCPLCNKYLADPPMSTFRLEDTQWFDVEIGK